MNPLGQVLVDALDGRFPEPDAGWTRLPLWRDGVEGAVAMTGHAFLAVGDDVTDAELERLGVDGIGGATNARTTATLAGEGYIECLDALLGCRAPGPVEGVEPLVERPDLAEHPRSGLAQRLRSEVRTFGLAEGGDVLVTLGRGIGGLREIGIEVRSGAHRGGPAVRSALALLPVGTPVLAACSPGNARAVRTFLAAGFVPLGEVQLWCPQRGPGQELRGV